MVSALVMPPSHRKERVPVNQPQYPVYPPAQPQYPQQGYPAQAPPAYPPTQPQYPAYPPAQPQYAQQAPPAQAGYPQQGYPAPPSPPPVPVERTTAAHYVEQPGVGGGNLQFPAPGHRHVVVVARPLGDGDFPPQTDMNTGQPKRFTDGRVMVRMVVPVFVPPDATHPDGRAYLSVQGQMAEALKQAMAASGAGDLQGIPESGAEITVAWISSRPAKRAGHNDQKIYEVIYRRPGQQAQPQAPAQYAPPPQAPAQYAPPPQAPAQYAPPPQAPAQYAPPPQAPAQYAPPPQAPASLPLAAPPGMDATTFALMKRASGDPLTPAEEALLAGGGPQPVSPPQQ
jgi:hypothetical protein